MNENKSFIKNKSTIILVVIILALLAVIIVPKLKKKSKLEGVIDTVSEGVQENHNLTEVDIESRLENAQELTTLKYIYHSADIYESSKDLAGFKLPFTTDMIVFSYDGTINIGIDLKDIDIKVDNERKDIDVTLSAPKILSHVLDEKSFEFRDAKNSIFNDTSMGDYAGFMAEQKEKEEERFMSNEEYLESVKKNTETVIEELVTTIDTENEYKIRFEYKTSP